MSNMEKPIAKKGGISGLVVILLIVGAFLVGMFWNQIKGLEKDVAELKSLKTGQIVNQPDKSGDSRKKIDEGTNANLKTAGQVDPVTSEDHVTGNRQADIFLIEYSDIECPFCKRFHPTMKKVIEEYGDKVGWVYRHFPLAQLHPDATKAAEASECVADLGGNDTFWKYLDILLGDSELTEEALTSAAGKVGINQSQFVKCLKSGKYSQKVADSIASGKRAGVSGTPGTVIFQVSTGKTQLIPGALPFEQVRTMIDSLL